MVLRVEKEREREYGAAHERTIAELEDLARRREAEFMSQTKTLHRLLQNNNNNNSSAEGKNQRPLPSLGPGGIGPGQTPRSHNNPSHPTSSTPESPHFFEIPGTIRGGLDGTSLNNMSNMSSFMDCSEGIASPIPLIHNQSSQPSTQVHNKTIRADEIEHDQQLATLQSRIDQLTSELAATSAALSMTQSERSHLAMDKTKREALMIANEEKIDLLTAKLQLIETEQAYLLTTECDRLLLEISQQKSQLSHTLEETSMLRQQLTERDQQLKERDQQLKERETASAESTEHIRLLGGQVSAFEKDLLAARARIQSLQQQNHRLDDTLTHVQWLETKLAQTEHEHNTTKTELLSRIEQKETLLQEQIKLSEKWKKRLDKGTKELKEVTRGKDKQERELLAQIDNLRSQIDSQDEEIAELRLDSLPSQQNCVQSRAGDMLSLIPFLQVFLVLPHHPLSHHPFSYIVHMF